MCAGLRFAAAAAIVLALLPAPAAMAGFVTGGELLGLCSPRRADPVYRLKVAECRGYVIGVADTFDCMRPSAGFRWNSAAPATQAALVNEVITWLTTHPDSRDYQANGLVAAALSSAHPCR